MTIVDSFRLFFDYEDFGYQFYEFSLQHLIATIVFALIPVAVIIVFRKRFASSRFDKAIAISAGIVGMTFEFVQYYWHYIGGQTDWRNIYPTTLCGLTIYLSSYAMITGNRTIGSVIYYYSYGAFFSFLLPQQSFGYDRFRFYAYFVIHGLIFFNSTYLVLVRGIRTDRKALFTSGLILLPVLSISILFNNIFSDPAGGVVQMNYFYLDHPPFDFPVYSWLYEKHSFLYTTAAFVSYYILFLVMHLVARVLNLNKTEV